MASDKEHSSNLFDETVAAFAALQKERQEFDWERRRERFERQYKERMDRLLDLTAKQLEAQQEASFQLSRIADSLQAIVNYGIGTRELKN